MTQEGKSHDIIRPLVTSDQAIALVKHFYGLEVESVKEFVGYDDRNFLISVNIEGASNQFILKVANSLDSENLTVLERQNQIMTVLSARGCKVQRPLLSKTGQLIHLHTLTTPLTTAGAVGDRNHAVRLLTFLPGGNWGESQLGADLLEEAAREVARVDMFLTAEMAEKVKNIPMTLWSLLSIPRLVEYVDFVQGDERQRLVKDIVQQFKTDVVEKGLPRLTQGCIHGDPNDNNILVENDRFSGLLDWQDVAYQYYVFDLAMLIMYTSYIFANRFPDQNPFNNVVGPLIKGFTAVCPLKDGELELLPILVAGRYAQSLTLGEYTYRVVDTSNTYLMQTSGSWSTLQSLWKGDITFSEMARQWISLSRI